MNIIILLVICSIVESYHLKSIPLYALARGMDGGQLKRQKIMDTECQQTATPLTSPPTNASITTCRECGESFPSRSKLFNHINFVHNAYGMKTPSNSIDSTHVDRDNIPPMLKLSKIYEDDVCLIVSKPQGLPSMGQKGLTLFNHPDLQFKQPNGSKKKCVPAHRLDKETGGLVLCGKNKESEIMLRMCVQEKWMEKKYHALVVGRLESDEGVIDSPVSGKRALTKYKVIKVARSLQGGFVTLIELWPVTGRKHQLRRHMKLIGHPIIGDKNFCPAHLLPRDLPNMCLWAVELTLPAPPLLLPLFMQHFFQEGRGLPDTYKVVLEGDDDKSGDEEEEEVVVEGQGGRSKGIEAIQALISSIDTITVAIPDPLYYEEFIARREQEWVEKNGDVKASEI